MTELLHAPSRRHYTESNREENIWNKVQAMLGIVEVQTEMDEYNLVKLKEKLNLEARKRRGRKMGQRKLLSAISKKYYSFFRCVYAQPGGRKKLRCDEHLVKSNGQVIYNMLKYFQAHLDIPKDDSAIDGDRLFEETDRFILRYLRDRKEYTNSSEIHGHEENSTDHYKDVLPTVSAAANVPNDPASLPGTGLPSQFLDATVILPENFPSYPLETTYKIPYLCPPNHTTLVGFRTFLLSRRNIALNADLVGKQIKSEVSNTTNFGGSSVSSSEGISPAEAAALWKERLASLFVWPAIMSNTVPKVMDHLFESDGPSVASTSHEICDGHETNVTELKTNRRLAKRRKRRRKKEKTVSSSPLQKKRKYEKSGKFKKVCEYVVQRRSTRHSSDPASALLE
jgi:hypothetical protein